MKRRPQRLGFYFSISHWAALIPARKSYSSILPSLLLAAATDGDLSIPLDKLYHLMVIPLHRGIGKFLT